MPREKSKWRTHEDESTDTEHRGDSTLDFDEYKNHVKRAAFLYIFIIDMTYRLVELLVYQSYNILIH